MEPVEEIVIVGAGLSGLATALGLHRYVFNLSVYALVPDLICNTDY
jgi:2-polyprenyl-6-methoxyphenol hydroxylase-like FAD-dependent oxidoreductase